MMNSRNILDIVLYLLNEDIFKKVLQAEIKYFSVMYPFLSVHQIRGKALGVMGIRSPLGEIPKVSKLLPMIYKRKIQEPIQTWNIMYIEKIFQPVISLAVKINCVRKNECSLKALKFPNLSEKKKFDDTDYDEIFHEEPDNTSSVTENIPHSNEKAPKHKTKVIVVNKTCMKSSESNATIMWPFQSTPPLHENNELRKPKCHSAISKDYLRFNFSNVVKIRRKKCSSQSKDAENSDVPEKLAKMKANKENHETQKRIVHRRDKDNVLLPVSEHAILREKSSTNEMGFLTDLFTPAKRKRLFPDNVIPIIKYRTPVNVSREES